MVKSIHRSFPQDGVDLHISALDALAHGINPGDPAVVEATVRPYTAEEWTAEAAEPKTQTEDEESDSPGGGHAPAPGAPVPTKAVVRGAVEGHTRISWRTTPGVQPIAAKPEPLARPGVANTAESEAPASHGAVEGHTRISWRSSGVESAAVQAEPIVGEGVGAGAGGDHSRIRWRSARVG